MLSQSQNCDSSTTTITHDKKNDMEHKNTKLFYNTSKKEFTSMNSSFKISPKLSYPSTDHHHHHYHHHYHHSYHHHLRHNHCKENAEEVQSISTIQERDDDDNDDCLEVEDEEDDQNLNQKSLYENVTKNHHSKNHLMNNGNDNENRSHNHDDDDDDDNNDNDNYLSDVQNESTTDSEFSDLSGLSDISGQEWKPMAKPLNWVQKQIHMGANPREILSQILPNGTTLPPNINDMTLWRILADILSELPRRQKLPHINTINDVVNLLKISKNIIVLTGAGVSVSCGIPDFRSNNGIYNRLAKDFPDLPDPQAMFDINYFSKDPRPFYKFAREIYPGQFEPSPCHRFIKLLEKKHKLLRNYTQNIDTLEQVAGIQNVIECHGSFATASCTRCKYKTNADAIRDDIFAQRIPKCPKCQKNRLMNDDNDNGNDLNDNYGDGEYYNNHNRFNECSTSSSLSSPYSEIVQNGIMKPDIVFFGEGLPDAFHTAMAIDKDKCDLLIVIGSSLKVRPVALIPSSIPPDVPQILINREQLNHLVFDVELLGDSDIIINHLCHLLGDGWEEVCWNSNILTETKYLKPKLSDNKDEEELLKSQKITTPLYADIIDSSSKSASTLTDGSNSPFCDSGFDSSSSHPGIIDGSSINHQLRQQQQQQQQQNQHQQQECSVTQSFPVKINQENVSNISLFNVSEKQSTTTTEYSSPSSSSSSSPSSSLQQSRNVQVENCSSNSFLMKQRHLSVDSSKDSGICDSSNIKSISKRTNNDDDSDNDSVNDNEDDNDDGNENNHKFIKNKNDIDNSQKIWPSNNKEQSLPSLNSSSSLITKSIADRLYENTYYHHPTKSSYVFPGAQVFWDSDSDENDDDDVEVENQEDSDDDDDDEDRNEEDEVEEENYEGNENMQNNNDSRSSNGSSDGDNDNHDDHDSAIIRNSCVKSNFSIDDDDSGGISSSNNRHKRILTNDDYSDTRSNEDRNINDEDHDEDDIPSNKKRKK